MIDRVNEISKYKQTFPTLLNVDQKEDILIFKFKTETDGTSVCPFDELLPFFKAIGETFPKNKCLFLPDTISLDSIIKLREIQEERNNLF